MLVLSRRSNECVMIGDGIKVTVLDIQGQQVKLGFEAPKEVSVHREEIYRRIQQVEKERTAADQDTQGET